MSINVSVGVMIPVDVLEVGQEISADQLAAIQNGSNTPSAANPFATNSFVQSQGYVTSSGLSQDQIYAIALTAIVGNFSWNGSNWQGNLLTDTPYFSANKASMFKFRMNNYLDFTPSWSGNLFSLSGISDDSSYTTTGSGESFTVKWNSANGGVPVI